MQYQEPFVATSETYVPSSDAHVPPSATYVPTHQSYAPSPQPYVPTPEPYVPSPEPYAPTPEPYVLKPEPYISTSEKTDFASNSQNTPPEKPDTLTRTTQFLNDYWVYEIAACVISLGTLAAIYGILHAFDGQNIESWSHSWSLSSMVQLLATVSQVALAVPLGSSISQLKWVWYRQSRKLTDLDAFDQSSRGPMGSVQLLFSRPFKFLGAFGALIMILTVSFHTLIQNAITTKNGQISFVDDDGALYPQGNNYSYYNKYSTADVLGDQGVSLDMLASINYGMFYEEMHPDTSTVQSVTTCESGNCTWDHVQTLSVCSQCANITSSIRKDQGYYTLYSTDLTMDERVGLVSSLGDTQYPDPTSIPGVGPLIIHLVTMARSTVDDIPVGIDCALWWCVAYEDNIKMDKYNVTHVNTTYWTDTSTSAMTTYLQADDIVLTSPTCYDEFGNSAELTECTKTVSAHAHLGIQNFFIGSFNGEATKNMTTGGWDVETQFVQLILSATGLPYTLVYLMETYMDNIGFSMSNNIRQNPQSGITNSSGTAFYWVAVYQIRWGFLIVPMVLVIATIIFMSITIFKSHGQEKWKASLLPLLFHPLVERPAVVPHKLSEINALAQKKQVKLEKSHTGSQFV